MAYSIIEQGSRDIDIFFRNSLRLIHIASGGGMLPNSLSEIDIINEQFIELISKIEYDNKIVINPRLNLIINQNANYFDYYFESFVQMAKKGFFSYDKTKLGVFEDMTYHLVAHPIDLEFAKKSKLTNSLPFLDIDLPITYTTFTLTDYFS